MRSSKCSILSGGCVSLQLKTRVKRSNAANHRYVLQWVIFGQIQRFQVLKVERLNRGRPIRCVRFQPLERQPMENYQLPAFRDIDVEQNVLAFIVYALFPERKKKGDKRKRSSNMIRTDSVIPSHFADPVHAHPITTLIITRRLSTPISTVELPFQSPIASFLDHLNMRLDSLWATTRPGCRRAMRSLLRPKCRRQRFSGAVSSGNIETILLSPAPLPESPRWNWFSSAYSKILSDR